MQICELGKSNSLFLTQPLSNFQDDFLQNDNENPNSIRATFQRLAKAYEHILEASNTFSEALESGMKKIWTCF